MQQSPDHESSASSETPPPEASASVVPRLPSVAAPSSSLSSYVGCADERCNAVASTTVTPIALILLEKTPRFARENNVLDRGPVDSRYRLDDRDMRRWYVYGAAFHRRGPPDRRVPELRTGGRVKVRFASFFKDLDGRIWRREEARRVGRAGPEQTQVWGMIIRAYGSYIRFVAVLGTQGPGRQPFLKN